MINFGGRPIDPSARCPRGRPPGSRTFLRVYLWLTAYYHWDKQPSTLRLCIYSRESFRPLMRSLRESSPLSNTPDARASLSRPSLASMRPLLLRSQTTSTTVALVMMVLLALLPMLTLPTEIWQAVR